MRKISSDEKFNEIHMSMVNGQDKIAKGYIKALKRDDRYWLVSYLKRQSGAKQYVDQVVKWCILGEWK